MSIMPWRDRLLALLLIGLVLVPTLARSEKKYGPGVTDTEIRIGQTVPYSGPASSYGTLGRAEAAYFQKVNAEGGVNGRKIMLLSLDDGYSPPRTVEQVRKLVEYEQVLLIFSSLGTPTNSAVQKYLNNAHVPHLFLASGASKWNDPTHFPWTMGSIPSYYSEAKVYAKYILHQHPAAKVAVLYQNDDYGKDYLKGLRDGLGDKAATMIAAEASYETTDATVDSQIIMLKNSGADVFVDITTPKFAAQAIRKVHDIGWKSLHLLNIPATSVAAVLQPAGLEKSAGIVSVASLKDPNDPKWKGDPGVADWLAWMNQYYPEGNRADWQNVLGYTLAQIMVQVLKQCGDDLTRENVLKQAADLHDLELPMLLPGIKINTSPTDYSPIKQMQLERFDGTRWVRFGDVMGN